MQVIPWSRNLEVSVHWPVSPLSPLLVSLDYASHTEDTFLIQYQHTMMCMNWEQAYFCLCRYPAIIGYSGARGAKIFCGIIHSSHLQEEV